MGTLKKYIPFFASALLMCLILLVSYPHYQYYIDPDGTSYLTISQRYATGDYLRAINGYWSPWACWLSALLIKAGRSAIPASVIINATGAAGFLFISHSFFLKFGLPGKLQWLFNITLACFLCYALFWQSFDDLWECFFLLSTLRIMLAEDYKSRPILWMVCGFIGTLAYFAKAYSFPFFILNTVCCTYFISKENKIRWLKISAVSIGVMVICSMPWIWLLHYKYGIWTTSTSGSLNMSWYLLGHPQWKEGIVALLPPPYSGSPYYWEDPYLVNGPTPHFWDSFHLLGLQLVKIAYHLFKFLKSMGELSVFFAAVWLVSLGILLSKKVKKYFTGDIYIPALSFFLFPLGYILINFESRYLWYMVPLSLIIGGLILSQIEPVIKRKWLSNTLYLVFSLSYLIFPTLKLYDMYDKGKDDYLVASCLKNNGILGAFTAETTTRNVPSVARIAYFSGNPFYSVPSLYASNDTLLQEMARYKIKYLLYYPCQADLPGFCGSATYDDPNLPAVNGYPYQIKNDTLYRFKVFKVNP